MTPAQYLDTIDPQLVKKMLNDPKADKQAKAETIMLLDNCGYSVGILQLDGTYKRQDEDEPEEEHLHTSQYGGSPDASPQK